MTTIEALGGIGILTEKDLEQFSKVEQRIIELMSDGKWYYASAIIQFSRQREALRRLRNLRAKGFTVEMKRDGESRDFLYKLTKQ